MSGRTATEPVPGRLPELEANIADLQRIMSRGWPGLEQERLGEWVVRFGGGYTGRANSALAVGDPGRPVALAVEDVMARYAGRGQDAIVQVCYPADGVAALSDSAELDALLAARDFHVVTPSFAMTAAVSHMASSGRSAPESLDIKFSDDPDDLLALYPDDLPIRRAVMMAGPARYLAIRDDADRVVARARLALVDSWCGVSDLHIVEHLRGRGIGQVAMAALVGEAKRHGCDTAYLQVMTSNTRAIAFYERLGWRIHHAYHYRRKAGSAGDLGAPTC